MALNFTVVGKTNDLKLLKEEQTGRFPRDTALPTLKRLNELFRVVGNKLHWYIDATHTAPTGVSCNVDGRVFSAASIAKCIGPKLSTGITITKDGRIRARKCINGKRQNLGYFSTIIDAERAIDHAR